MENFDQGFFLISRSIFDNEIFTQKPHEWFKIWFYILWKVNFRENWLPKWSRHFKFSQMALECNVSPNVIRHCVDYLRKCWMCVTQKATHGIVISVLKYETYQNISNYESHTKSHTEVTQKSHRSHNINKNGRMEEWNNIEESYHLALEKDIKERTVTDHFLVCAYDLWYIPAKGETVASLSKWLKESADIKNKSGDQMIDIIRWWHIYWKWQKKPVLLHKQSLLNQYSYKWTK